MMRKTSLAIVLAAISACSSAANKTPAPPAGDTGGAGGDPDTTGGTGGSTQPTGTGGSGGSGGAGAGGSAGDDGAGVDAATATPDADNAAGDGAAPSQSDVAVSSGDGGGAQKSSMGHPGSIAWYEAEDGALFGRAVKSKCKPCPSTATMKAGDACCSGGGEVTWIVAAKTSDLQLNGIDAPADGMYDVTFWYYCGNNDNFNDRNCGGQTNPPTTPAGCRPHQFIVNGTLMPGAYHFPCFGGAWSIVRTATVTMPLKGGANTIRMHAPPPRDCVNLDGIELYPTGKGLQPAIMSNPDLTGH
jgi:hypothetical protein